MTHRVPTDVELGKQIMAEMGYSTALTLADVRDRAVLRVAEAAEVMGVSRQVAYSEIRAGRWPSIRAGRGVRVPVPALRRMLGDLDA